MLEIPGAVPRQSRTLQTLSHLTQPTRDALAAAALVLFDAINGGFLVVNDELSADQAEATGDLLDALYDLQDAVHGDSSRLPLAMALVLLTAECGAIREQASAAVMSGAAKGGAQ